MCTPSVNPGSYQVYVLFNRVCEVASITTATCEFAPRNTGFAGNLAFICYVKDLYILLALKGTKGLKVRYGLTFSAMMAWSIIRTNLLWHWKRHIWNTYNTHVHAAASVSLSDKDYSKWCPVAYSKLGMQKCTVLDISNLFQSLHPHILDKADKYSKVLCKGVKIIWTP